MQHRTYLAGYVHMRLIVAIIAVLVCGIGHAQDVLEVQLRDKANGTVSINRTSDTIEARVWSQKGIVRGLKQEDFIVTEGSDTATIGDFREVPTESTADMAFTFILDNSGSMFDAYDSLTTYLDQFVDLIGEGAVANVITFDNVERSTSYEGVRQNRMFIALSGFTEDKQAMKDFWHFYDTIRSDFTPLYDAAVSGLLAIRDRRAKGDVARHEIVMVITDGADNMSKTRLGELEELAEAMRITLYTVSYRSEPDRKLAWLVRKTGGRHYDATSLTELAEAISKLRKEFTSVYRMTYAFPLKGAGNR